MAGDEHVAVDEQRVAARVVRIDAHAAPGADEELVVRGRCECGVCRIGPNKSAIIGGLRLATCGEGISASCVILVPAKDGGVWAAGCVLEAAADRGPAAAGRVCFSAGHRGSVAAGCVEKAAAYRGIEAAGRAAAAADQLAHGQRAGDGEVAVDIGRGDVVGHGGTQSVARSTEALVGRDLHKGIGVARAEPHAQIDVRVGEDGRRDRRHVGKRCIAEQRGVEALGHGNRNGTGWLTRGGRSVIAPIDGAAIAVDQGKLEQRGVGREVGPADGDAALVVEDAGDLGSRWREGEERKESEARECGGGFHGR